MPGASAAAVRPAGQLVGCVRPYMNDPIVGQPGRQPQPVAQHRISRHPTGADRIGDDRQRITASRAGTRQGLDRRQQVLEAGDAKDAGTPQRCLERAFCVAAGVRQQRAGPDRHHWTQP